jgi:hypothetical protein
MLGLFKRAAKLEPIDIAGLGGTLVALPLAPGCSMPAGCCAVIADHAGRTRRVDTGSRMAIADGDSAWCFHPGPYSADLAPFAAAPEIGLRVTIAVDSPDPRLSQQRFDLFLASESGGRVELVALVQSIEQVLQRELAQGNLDLPPCTTLDEWNAFRAGFNQLLYTRFGLTVDDCVPVDLGDTRDFAQVLLARAADAPPEAVRTATAPVEPRPQPFAAATADAAALRRLFLELPCLMGGLRLAALPASNELFRLQQGLLQRLDLVSLSVDTMPALELVAPGQALVPAQQQRRARHSCRAVAALDEGWALLARLERADDEQLAALLDEADRIVANLEHDCSGRRATAAEGECA